MLAGYFSGSCWLNETKPSPIDHDIVAWYTHSLWWTKWARRDSGRMELPNHSWKTNIAFKMSLWLVVAFRFVARRMVNQAMKKWEAKMKGSSTGVENAIGRIMKILTAHSLARHSQIISFFRDNVDTIETWRRCYQNTLYFENLPFFFIGKSDGKFRSRNPSVIWWIYLLTE